jgi:hypothetical protein
MEEKMGVWAKKALFLFTVCSILVPMMAGNTPLKAGSTYDVEGGFAMPGPGAVSLSHTEELPTIEWFKKELRISPKYTEEHEGVFGLSWAHFLTMVFLILFFVLGLAVLVIRYRRTRELLTMLLKEEERETKS